MIATTGLRGAVEVAVGEKHACARLEDGGVSCWGNNGYGQIGNGQVVKWSVGDPDEPALPTVVKGLRDVKKIAAGGYHTCAVRGDDTVVCWGLNRYGQCNAKRNQAASGKPCSTPAEVPGLRDVQDLALAELGSCALLKDGTVKCWGVSGVSAETGGSLTPVKSVAGARRIFRGTTQMCVELGDGAVRCFWDPDAPWTLGVKLTDVKTITHTTTDICLLGQDKKLKCGVVQVTSKDRMDVTLSDVCL